MKHFFSPALLALAATLATATSLAHAQEIPFPKASPKAKLTEQIGVASLEIEYSRPSVKGRKVFGDLVPWGEVWRTGANAATVLATDKALDFGGIVVPAGKYSVWTLPTKSGWTLILNSQSGQWGTEHDASKDLYKIALAVEALPDVVERFTINVLPRDTGGVLQLDWDTTRASVGFAVK